MYLGFFRFTYEQYIKYRELEYTFIIGRGVRRFVSSIDVFFRGKTVNLIENEKEKIGIKDNKTRKSELLDRKATIFSEKDQYGSDDDYFYNTSALVYPYTKSRKDSSTNFDADFLKIDDQHRKDSLPDDFLVIESGATITNSNDNKTTSFSREVESGNIEIVNDLLREGADPNSIEKIMPLARAVRNKNGSMVNCLLKWGAGINISGSSGYTALEEATRINSVEMASLLLDTESNIYVEKSTFINALLTAINGSHVDMVKIFLNYEAVQNSLRGNWIDSSEITESSHPIGLKNIKLECLMSAIRSDNVKMVQILLDAGVDSYAAPLYLAVATNKVEIVKLLLEKRQFIIQINNGSIVKELGLKLKSGSESDNLTPLELAAALGHCPMMRILLHNGATISYFGFENAINSLTFAIKEGHLNATCLLLNTGAFIYAGSTSPSSLRNVSAIEVASIYGRRRILRAIMAYSTQHTVSVSAETQRQCCEQAIFYAAMSNQVGIIKDLCVYASINIKDVTDGASFLTRADGRGCRDIVTYLLTNNAKVKATLRFFYMTKLNLELNKNAILTLKELSALSFVKGHGLQVKDIDTEAMISLLPTQIITIIRNCSYLCPINKFK